MKHRHAKGGRKILSTRVTIDDVGTEVYLCDYTKTSVWADNCSFLGPCIPQLSGSYVCSLDALPEFRVDKKAFDSTERNCNTCKNFTRLPHQRCNQGFLRGNCYVRPPTHFLFYRVTPMDFWIHPNDCMNMECWQPR